MRCPVCQSLAEEPRESCVFCGFSLENLDEVFSADEQRLGPVTDSGALLEGTELAVIRTFLQDFHQAFPQLSIMVYVGRYTEETDLGARETAFWLANRSRSSAFSFRHRRSSMLLYVDPHLRRAVLSAGYGLEGILDEDELKLVLNQGRRYMRLGDFGRGIMGILTALSSLLIMKSTSSVRKEALR